MLLRDMTIKQMIEVTYEVLHSLKLTCHFYH